jgi:hypothetical protein
MLARCSNAYEVNPGNYSHYPTKEIQPKTYILHLLAVVSLIASFVVAPADVTLAAQEWTRTSVIATVAQASKFVKVDLNYSHSDREKVRRHFRV